MLQSWDGGDDRPLGGVLGQQWGLLDVAVVEAYWPGITGSCQHPDACPDAGKEPSRHVYWRDAGVACAAGLSWPVGTSVLGKYLFS